MREYIVQYERKETDNPKDKCDLCNHAIVGEVVRCKDCRHYGSDGGALMVCDVSDMVVDDTDYCSYGERREE